MCGHLKNKFQKNCFVYTCDDILISMKKINKNPNEISNDGLYIGLQYKL